jgi:hypothetical protein
MANLVAPTILTVWLTLGVPLLFGLVLQLYYRAASAKGDSMPFHSRKGGVIWFATFSACLISGLFAVLLMPISGTWPMVAAAIGYVVAMALVLVLVATWLSVRNGDSLKGRSL